MYRFRVKVEKRGEGYIATILAVPGCVSGGRTREEALRKVREVLLAIVTQAGPYFPITASGSHESRVDGGEAYVDVALPSQQPC